MPLAVTYELSTATNYRRQLALARGKYDLSGIEYGQEREQKCDQDTGHVLHVSGGKIVCRQCGAEWIESGF